MLDICLTDTSYHFKYAKNMKTFWPTNTAEHEWESWAEGKLALSIHSTAQLRLSANRHSQFNHITLKKCYTNQRHL